MDFLKSKKNVVILGASGWIGKNFIDLLEKTKNYNLHLYSSSSTKKINFGNGSVYETSPISKLSNLDMPDIDIFIDLAFPTQDKIELLGNKGYLNSIKKLQEIKENFLSKTKPKNIFVASSGAIYWNEKESNLYSKGKLSQEQFYEDYFKTKSTNILIMRIFGLLARHFSFDKNYAFTSFIKQAKEENIIRVKSNKLVIRSYITFPELFLFFEDWVNYHNSDFQIIDSCSFTTEIRNLAQIISNFYGVKIVDNNKIIGEDRYVGSTKVMEEFLSKRNIESNINSEKIINLLC